MDRPTTSIHPLRFGRSRSPYAPAPRAPMTSIGDDLKLFATTFAAGFLFVSLYLV
jgi:hypothetical protein